MNIPKAIELALAETIRNYSEVGTGVVVRPWQSISTEQIIAKEGQREYPMIDIRCGSPATDDQVTRYCEASLICGTYAQDDKDHAQISELYEAAQESLDLLHDQFMAGSGAAYAAFVTYMEAEIEGIHIGGVSFSAGNPPYEDTNANLMAISITVHYSK